MKIIELKNSDILGASATPLCLAHCILSPLLFLSPIWWWSSLNILFISISFIAVYNSVKKTSRKIMKPLFWIGFSSLTLSIINEEFHFLHVPELFNYSAAAFLAGLHIYNLKYCQCKDDQCCIHKD
ncbi:MAG: MerC domain-containing protein [Flavobacteriaceae bacterium]